MIFRFRSRALVLTLACAASGACMTPGPHTAAAPALASGAHAAPQERALLLRNAWVRVRDVGTAAAGEAPILLVHGYGSRLESFRLVQDELAKEHRVIAFDQRGFGRSERSEGPYGVVAHADDVFALMDALAIDRAVLVGHSYGGGVVLRAALAHPERAAAVVLVSPFAASAQMNTFLAWAQVPGVGEYLFATSYREFPGEKMRLAFGPATDEQGKTSPHPYVTLAALDEVRANQSLPGTDYAALATVRGMTYDDVEPRYASLAMPVTVVWGEQDRVLPLRDAHALLALLPESTKVVRVPNVGHMPLAESPAVVVSVIENAVAPPPSRAEGSAR